MYPQHGQPRGRSGTLRPPHEALQTVQDRVVLEEVGAPPELDLRASLASGFGVRGPDVVPVNGCLVQREDARHPRIACAQVANEHGERPLAAAAVDDDHGGGGIVRRRVQPSQEFAEDGERLFDLVFEAGLVEEGLPAFESGPFFGPAPEDAGRAFSQFSQIFGVIFRTIGSRNSFVWCQAFIFFQSADGLPDGPVGGLQFFHRVWSRHRVVN
mmetsp:Transcript_4404/g.9204  ORF Transcript_4404/g.9204 Transcript_4404/m.9204 type:complete len:213 (-) Transcript_4404:8-646(-)